MAVMGATSLATGLLAHGSSARAALEQASSHRRADGGALPDARPGRQRGSWRHLDRKRRSPVCARAHDQWRISLAHLCQRHPGGPRPSWEQRRSSRRARRERDPSPGRSDHVKLGGDGCHEPRRSHCPPRRARITPGRAVVAKRKGVTAPLRRTRQTSSAACWRRSARQNRTYGETTVYTKTETKPGLSRPIEWTDVFLTRGAASPQNVSACDGVNCVQPSLSPDGRSVAFVKLQD